MEFTFGIFKKTKQIDDTCIDSFDKNFIRYFPKLYIYSFKKLGLGYIAVFSFNI